MTDRQRKIYQAASLIAQYGPQGGRKQGHRIDLLLDEHGWLKAETKAYLYTDMAPTEIKT